MGIWEFRTFNVASDQEPQQVRGMRASASLFTVLGVPPAMAACSRLTEDERRATSRVISDAIWRTHLGGDLSASDGSCA